MTAEFFHRQVWDRFIRMPYGHLLDYVDVDGKVYIPTKEECEKAIPNPLGWWTPIENGAFFGGIYLCALLKKYKDAPDGQTEKEIEILVNGLFLLQDVGSVGGFIARGVADDGRAHYPFSSEDQFTPWVLGLYSYYNSSLCRDREGVKQRLLRALFAVKGNGWNIPCDVEGLYYCRWGKSTAWRGVTKLLFCARVIYELTGDRGDLDYYENLAEEYPEGSIFSRREIVSHGYSHDLVAFLGTKQNWICACAHLGLGELARLDEKNREFFVAGLKSNGITACKIIDDIKKYDNKQGGFDVNWRRLNPMWEDYGKDVTKGLSIAMKQNGYWLGEVVPHRKMEHEVLGNALFSALIAITCGDEKISALAKSKLCDAVGHVDWEGLHLSYAFVVECGMIL